MPKTSAPQTQEGPEASSGFATPERAREIAHLPHLKLKEFIELTGVGVGDFGIYRISQYGIHLRHSAADDALTPAQQVDALHADGELTLNFPSTPEKFLE